jgi:hypothetical protein
MFQIVDKATGREIKNVYAVKEVSVSGDLEFLTTEPDDTFNRKWVWIKADDYNPYYR